MSEQSLGMPGTVAWPLELANEYRTAGYWRDQTIDTAFQAWVARSPEQLAVVCGERRWSYRELDHQVEQLAGGLQRLGLRPRDRAVLQLPNCAEWLVTFFALMRCGVIPVLALPAHRYAEIRSFCQQSAAVAYLGAAQVEGYDYRPMLSQVRESCPSLHHTILLDAGDGELALENLAADEGVFEQGSADHVALFQLSGGSTGTPKLIPRTHNDYLYSVEASADVCELTPKSVYMCVLPMAHNFPLSSPGTLGTLAAGGTLVIAPQPTPERAFDLITKESVTITAVVPPLALLWLEAAQRRQIQLKSLHVLQVGGAPLGQATAERIEQELGCCLQQVYGMAEGLVNYTRLDDPKELVYSTQGRPLSPADQIRIIDADERDLPPGELGQLLTRGPYTIRGYYAAEQHNRHAFTSDGWYRTGDLVRLTPEGYLMVQGRVKDQINRGGEKIAAEEVEYHLLAHPAIQAAALIAMPDQWLGERSCAVLVSRDPSLKRRTLVTYLRERGLAEYKIPDRVVLVPQLPTTPVGKIDKRFLREQLAAGELALAGA